MSATVDTLGANLYSTDEVEKKVSKADTVQKVGFTAQVGTIPTIFKAEEDFVIWGPASVEVVDKEGDLIEASALSDALPQLLKRARLSLEHSDQLVGEILERFETEEPVEVAVGGQTFQRSEFPTDVMDLEDIEPALYVTGKVWDDSRQARETRKRIQEGEIDSYSISGEALVTRTKVDGGKSYDEIVDMDLSAVTLCEQGMNQKAKFGVVAESDEAQKAGSVSMDESPTTTPEELQSVAKSAIQKTMTEENEEDGTSKSGGGSGLDLDQVEEKFEEVISGHLPDGELATKDDVEDTVSEMIEQQDRASAQDDTDDEGVTNFRHEDVENPFDRPFSPAVVERMVDKITEKLESEYDLERGDHGGEMDEEEEDDDNDLPEELANQYGVSREKAEELLLQMGDDEMPDEEEEEEMPGMDEEDDMEMSYSAEELERQLPEDVFSVVSEYIEASEARKSAPSDEGTDEGVSKSDVEEAVESVLKGRGLDKTGGVEGAEAASGEDPEPSFEKGEDPNSTGSEGHPALAQIYDREQ